jgi:heme/copper-type cytochrome/quinol oxidase subunit 3
MAQTAVAGKQRWWEGGKSPFNVEYGKLMMWYFLMSDAFTFGAFLIPMKFSLLFLSWGMHTCHWYS